MRRVLKPGGRVAFVTWPPEHLVGRMFPGYRISGVLVDIDASVHLQSVGFLLHLEGR